MALTLITPPAVEPVTLQEAKDHLRVDGAEEDALISEAIAAARLALDGPDGWLERALITQTWDWTFDGFPDGDLAPPLPPLQSVASIAYVDPAGTIQTLPASAYKVSLGGGRRPRIAPAYGTSWPVSRAEIDAVKVRLVAGFGLAPASVPAPIRAALLLLIGHLHAQRETEIVGASVAELPTVANLLAPYRWTVIA